MFGLAELIFSIIGIYGFFTQNLICVIVGLVCIVLCDFIDTFFMETNPTTIILACLFAIGMSMANKNPLYSFTVSLCGESLLLLILGYGISIRTAISKRSNDVKETERIKDSLSKMLNYNKSIDLDKYVELSKIIMARLNVESIDEAIEKTYSFYKEQGIDVERVEIDNANKFKTLAELVMLGLSTNNIDEAIQETKEFYNNQENKEENRID